MSRQRYGTDIQICSMQKSKQGNNYYGIHIRIAAETNSYDMAATAFEDRVHFRSAYGHLRVCILHYSLTNDGLHVVARLAALRRSNFYRS